MSPMIFNLKLNHKDANCEENSALRWFSSLSSFSRSNLNISNYQIKIKEVIYILQ